MRCLYHSHMLMSLYDALPPRMMQAALYAFVNCDTFLLGICLRSELAIPIRLIRSLFVTSSMFAEGLGHCSPATHLMLPSSSNTLATHHTTMPHITKSHKAYIPARSSISQPTPLATVVPGQQVKGRRKQRRKWIHSRNFWTQVRRLA